MTTPLLSGPRVFAIVMGGGLMVAVAVGTSPAQPPQIDDIPPRQRLEELIRHGFTTEEMARVLQIPVDQVEPLRKQLGAWPFHELPARHANDPLRILPYPGVRHPRIGFLEGAVNPRAESKFSVFAPWDERHYVVVDFPEAVFSNLGLIYLAHTHVETVWTRRGVELPEQTWIRRPHGDLFQRRDLPNRIAFETWIRPQRDRILMRLILHNRTDALLSGLRVQICAMLKMMGPGFNAVDNANANKLFAPPYAAVCDRPIDSQALDHRPRRWVILGFEPIQRTWGNPPVPCLHADPQIPDCPPGQHRSAQGALWFFEGEDVRAELRRLDQTDWRTAVWE